MKMCGIYSLENSRTGDQYIGQSVQLSMRRSDHLRSLSRGNHYNIHLQRAFTKYGVENFSFRVLLYCESFELTRYEQFFVDALRPSYNIRRECVTSPLGCSHEVFEGTRQRISQSLQGHSVSEGTREKLRQFNLGKSLGPLSLETRQKLSQHFMGHPVSEEARYKMSESGKKRYLNMTEEERIEARRKNSEGQKRRHSLLLSEGDYDGGR